MERLLGFTRKWSLAALHLAWALSLILIQAGPANATGTPKIINVNSLADTKADDGSCSLREAIIAANTNKASGYKLGECTAGSSLTTDVIRLTLAGTYALTRTDSGNEDSALSGDLDIKGNVTISPQAQPAIIDASQITDRVFHILSGKVTISQVTIKGGRVSHEGGGIYNKGTLILENSTISGNSANGLGGGIFNSSYANLSLNFVTVANNTAKSGGGGIKNLGKVTVQNTIIAGNSSPSATKYSDCLGVGSSQGYNLFGQGTGCPATSTDRTVSPGAVFTTVFDALATGGANAGLHALLPGSPAINKAKTTCPPPATDQRGISRPQNGRCDIGAFEFQEPVQATGPIFIVNTANDTDDGTCNATHCSLREAIKAANTRPNDNSGPTPIDQIHFAIPGQAVISPTSALPVISATVIISGTTQPGGSVELRGGSAGATTTGLTINTSNSILAGFTVTGFGSHGVLLTGNNNSIRNNLLVSNQGDGLQVASGNNNQIKNNWLNLNKGNGAQVATGNGNTIGNNTITSNSADGIRIIAGNGNALRSNHISDNGQLGIDLGNDEVTALDPGDGDGGPNNQQNSPVIFRATPGGGGQISLEGRLNSNSNLTYQLEFFINTSCDPTSFGEGAQFLGTIPVSIGADTHDLYFSQTFTPDPPVSGDQFITATATDPAGNTSEFSPCVAIGQDNDIWTRALELQANPSASASQYIDVPGRSRWYKFSIEPNSQVMIELTNLPANYDLFLYKDIQATFDQLTNPDAMDVVRLSAEFAPGAPSPGAPSPGAPSPGAPSPGAPSPGAPSLDAYAPGAPSPGAPSPGAPSPGAPSLYDFAPGAPSPGAPSPGAPSPGAPSFSSAETRSFMASSTFEGLVDEIIVANTWNNSGDFYIRVSGNNGAFNLNDPFQLEVTRVSGSCDGLTSLPTGDITILNDEGHETVILTDLERMAKKMATLDPGSPDYDPLEAQAFAELPAKLATLANQVNGVVIDVHDYAFALNEQADDQFDCPYAKNLVAGAIKEVVDDYRPEVEYVVIIGGDEIIPFFRHPDKTDLGNEAAYLPPVQDDTASEASLRLGYVLSQDGYGTEVDLSLGGSTLPFPDLAVGRLVEMPTEINHILDVFPANGEVTLPSNFSAFVSGYDFLEDGASAVADEFTAALGQVETLIADQEAAPEASWTANDLRRELLSSRHDIIYLAGHFSANSALAADYSTYVRTTDILEPNTPDLTNALVYSPGCHSGYNIVNEHGIPFVTFEPDWAQTFARKGATFIGGTGYQYGDTEFIEYSERLYLEFTRQLRTGADTLSVGQAMVAAKQDYLAGVPFLRGMHEKALLEATIFGLPMFTINLPGPRLSPPNDSSITAGEVEDVPGNSLDLQVADITISPNLGETRSLDVINIENNSAATLTWLQGRDGVVTNPGEPVLPRHVENVTVAGKILRGMVFLGSTYQDESDEIPLVGRPTTELAPVLSSFSSDIFFPTRFWNINYFDTLADGGATRLILMPAQHMSSTPGSQTHTRRAYNNVNFLFYYIGDQDSEIDLVDAPTIVNVSANEDVTFRASVIGDPGVEIEGVWVTYTGINAPFFGQWQSLPLTQDSADTRLWEGTLPVSAGTARDIRYFVQACNGAGLCSMETNQGAYYIPGAVTDSTLTTLALAEANPDAGAYGTSATFKATLTTPATETEPTPQPLADQPVTFVLGPVSRQAKTNGSGEATVTLPLLGLPGEHTLRATFGGTFSYTASADTAPFIITKQNTNLALKQPASGFPDDDTLVVATLKDATGRPLAEETIFFIVRKGGGIIHHQATGITNHVGQAILGNVPPPQGVYGVEAYFNGTIPLSTPIVLASNRYNPSSATGSLTLKNTPPVAIDDSYTFSQTLVITAPGVLGNDTDPDGDPLTVIQVTQPQSGTLTMTSNGAFSYTPTLNFSSTDSFSYTVSDGQGGTDIAKVNLVPSGCFTVKVILPYGASSIWPPNGQFVIAQLSSTTVTSLTVTGIFQDEPVGKKDVDGIFVSATKVKLRAKRDGNGDGRVYHILFNGIDAQGNPCNGDARVGVVHSQSNLNAIDGGPLYDSTKPGNHAPKAMADTFTTTENTQLIVAAPKVLSNDTDPDGDPLKTTVVVQPGKGALTLNLNGGFRYMPSLNFSGVDTFIYQASDGTAVSTATITITVTPVNDPPLAVADEASTGEADLLEVETANGVLANDSDTESAALTVTAVNDSGAVGSAFTLPSGASVTMQADGSYSYDPAEAFLELGEGETATDSFTYTVSDGQGGTATATVTLTISGQAEDLPPVANDDTYNVAEGEALTVPAPGLLENDNSSKGETLTAVLVSGPEYGTLNLDSNGAFSYSPPSDFSGTDTFTYQASDGANLSNPATVNITVDSVNGAPEAADDQASTAKDTSLPAINVLGNDTDPEGDSLTVTGFDTSATVGTVTDNGDGTFSYDPNGQFSELAEGETASDAFTYTVDDGNGGTATATVILTITGVTENAPPVAGDDSVTLTENSSVAIDVASNDSDPDGNLDTGSGTVTTEPSNGTVTKNPEGTFTYTPNPDFSGTDSFSYQICDSEGLCSNTAIVNIEITSADEAPDAQDDAYTTDKKDPLAVTAPGVLGNDTDTEGASLVVTAVEGDDSAVGQEITLPSGALLTLNADGTFTFAPLPNFKGEDQFTYTVSDGTSSDTATVTITVLKPNQ